MNYKQLKALLEAIGIGFIIFPTDENQSTFEPFFFALEPFKVTVKPGRVAKEIIAISVFQHPQVQRESVKAVVHDLLPLLKQEGIVVDRYELIEWPDSPDRYTYKLDPEEEKFTHNEPETMNFGEHQ